MAIQHRQKPIVGLQFHPESMGTNEGAFLSNGFLNSFQKTQQKAANEKGGTFMEAVKIQQPQQITQQLFNGSHLSYQEMRHFAQGILSGMFSESQLGQR